MRRPTRRRGLLAALLALTLVVAACAAVALTRHREPARTATPGLRPVRQVLGAPPAGAQWLSGAWAGNPMSASGATAFGAWRGRPLDLVTTYPERPTFAKMADSEWHVSTFDGAGKRLSYGLPLLPDGDEGTLDEVAAGTHDAVFSKIARDLVAHGRSDSVVRVGWEANASWYRWGATASTAGSFKAAFRHVVGVLHQQAPHLVIDFDISCGTGLRGSSDRTAAFTQLYPGDDVVDIVGCDVYDVWKTRAANDAQWASALAPSDAPGLADLVSFAASRGKPFAVPEWGLWKADDHGGGDNPYYIEKMHSFFAEHHSRLAYEAYFDEKDDYIKASLWADTGQNPRAGAAYRRLWGMAPAS